ncbi:hypothetical protein C8R46DRAFT_1209648 [Mycena filopes]|nr:hypothetical protein C8R46DRAFT_1209648 [Mycena filopes]
MAKLTPTLGANVLPKLVLSIAQHLRGCRARPRRPPRAVVGWVDIAMGALASCFAANGPASPPVNTPTFSRSTADFSKAAIYAETTHGLPHSQPSSCAPM